MAEFTERNIVERAKEITTDTKNRMRGEGELGWFISTDINRNTPTT